MSSTEITAAFKDVHIQDRCSNMFYRKLVWFEISHVKEMST